MVFLCAIEALQRSHLGYDCSGKNLSSIQLRDVGFGNAPLLVIGIKNDRAIGRSLAVELRGIVSHGKENAQKLSVSNPGRIVNNLNGFGVSGGLSDDLVVSCS